MKSTSDIIFNHLGRVCSMSERDIIFQDLLELYHYELDNNTYNKPFYTWLHENKHNKELKNDIETFLLFEKIS